MAYLSIASLGSSSHDLLHRARRTHGDLSAAAASWLATAERRPELLRPLDYKADPHVPEWALRKTYPVQTWPFLIDERKRSELARAACGVAHLVKTLPERLFQRDPAQLACFLGLDNELLAMLLLEPPNGLKQAVARCDFVDTEAGLRCVEVNLGAYIGGWQLRFWQDVCRRHPPTARFLAEHGLEPVYRDPLDELLRHLAEDCLPLATDGRLDVAIVVDPQELADALHLASHLDERWTAILEARAPHLAGAIILTRFGADTLAARGSLLYHGGARLHAVVECTAIATPPEVYRAFKAGGLRLYNGPLSVHLSSKRSLAVLSRQVDSPLLDDDERAMIRELIPWTRELREGKLDFHGQGGPVRDVLAEHREQLLIKPERGSRGEGVVVGRFTSAQIWRDNCEAALRDGGFIIQEFLESRSYLCQSGEEGCDVHDAVWGLFCFEDRYGGGFLRLQPHDSTNGVINSARGAVQGILLEV